MLLLTCIKAMLPKTSKRIFPPAGGGNARREGGLSSANEERNQTCKTQEKRAPKF